LGFKQNNQEFLNRFLFLALYQGIPKVDQQFLLQRSSNNNNIITNNSNNSNIKGASGLLQDNAASMAEMEENQPKVDPTLFVTNFQKRRFYCFSTRNPITPEDFNSRDIINELPTLEEKSLNQPLLNVKKQTNEVVLRTTFGDIFIKLYSHECPRTIENFVTHIRNKFYDNLLFHRVIKGFMIQTGDPKGDGTGGTSIWNTEFEDEFHKSLKFVLYFYFFIFYYLFFYNCLYSFLVFFSFLLTSIMFCSIFDVN
jgi:hypothetical protein